jgi:hypothetical protein
MASRQDNINLTDPEFFATDDPHQLFKRMRTEDPVHALAVQEERPLRSAAGWAAWRNCKSR